MSEFLKVMAPTLRAAVLGCGLGLLVAIVYCWQNEAGHSGFEPMLTLLLYTPVVAFGVVGVFAGRETLGEAAMLVLIGIAGMTFGVFVSKLGILMQYERWIEAGMPERNPNATHLLASFAIATVIGCVTTLLLMRRLPDERSR